MSLNYFATGKSFGKCVSPSAMNSFAVIELTFATDIWLSQEAFAEMLIACFDKAIFTLTAATKFS